jgi:hypothetical protein
MRSMNLRRDGVCLFRFFRIKPQNGHGGVLYETGALNSPNLSLTMSKR